MADVYADSSALVKRHIPEVGSSWFQALVDPIAGNVITTARISMAEVYSALNRRIREATLDAADYTHIVADFDALCATQYTLVELTALIVERARVLLERHPLRAYDAVQLASALTANDALAAAGLPALTFLSADHRLLNAAQMEGIATDNPNAHP
jgi:predicted nucleic acid-binding protein